MIEIDHTLLSKEALENLIIDIITRQTTDYGEYETDIQIKKNQLKRKLQSGDAVIVYSSKEDTCNIISQKDFQTFKNILITNIHPNNNLSILDQNERGYHPLFLV